MPEGRSTPPPHPSEDSLHRHKCTSVPGSHACLYWTTQRSISELKQISNKHTSVFHPSSACAVWRLFSLHSLLTFVSSVKRRERERERPPETRMWENVIGSSGLAAVPLSARLPARPWGLSAPWSRASGWRHVTLWQEDEPVEPLWI